MAQTSIDIHMDGDLKKQLGAFCSDIGMSISTALCVFVGTATRERRIPFEISTEKDPFYSAAGMTRLEKSITGMEATGDTVREVELGD